MENILTVPQQCQYNKGKNLRATAGDRLTVSLEQNLPVRPFFQIVQHIPSKSLKLQTKF